MDLHSRDCRCHFMPGFAWIEPRLSIDRLFESVTPGTSLAAAIAIEQSCSGLCRA